MSKQKPPNPLGGNASQTEVPLSAVIDCIGTIIKTPSTKQGETGKYHIPIKYGERTQDIVLSTAQLLSNHNNFSTIFTDLFNKKLFVNEKDKEWYRFTDWVLESAVPGEPDDTPAVMAGHMLFERIVSLTNISDDKTKLLEGETCDFLVEHMPQNELWYVIPGGAVHTMADDLPIKADHGHISQAMTVCGYKRKNTHDVKVFGKPIRCWWFKVDKVKEYIGDGGNADVR